MKKVTQTRQKPQSNVIAFPVRRYDPFSPEPYIDRQGHLDLLAWFQAFGTDVRLSYDGQAACIIADGQVVGEIRRVA